MSLIGRLLGTLVKRGRLTVITPDGQRESYGPGNGGKAMTIRFTDHRLALQIVRNPRLAFGEAYMDGRLIIEEGTILDLMQLIVGANRWEDGGRGRKLMSTGKMGDLAALFRRNPAAKAKQNVAHHYDLSDELYDLFLDEDRQYSCAYYTDPANSLEQAQADKKAHIAAKLDLKPGQRVLDIGCGWGGMAMYLNQVAGVEVLGVTLSKEQLSVASRRAEEAGVSAQVRFELIDYRSVEGEFDRIVSVGMFEHVGAAHYEEFYATCHKLMKRDGVMLLHTIGKLGSAGPPDPFTDKWIFPGYHLPSLSQMSAASEKVRLIASDVETLRVHYAYTLRAWLDRCETHKSKIVALYDERFYRMWQFYLAGGIVMFEAGAACNYQVQYVRDRYAVPITRDYMVEAERKYRAI